MHLMLGELLSRKLGCLHRILQRNFRMDVVCVKIRERKFQELVLVSPLYLTLGKI